jgi:hypothetical protein
MAPTSAGLLRSPPVPARRIGPRFPTGPLAAARSCSIFVTSNGYLRTGPRLDVYHFALVDVVSESGFSVNNLSGGLNFRPWPSLRMTASVNHVDTETLAVQARTFLEPESGSIVRNTTQVRRISSTQAQGGVSAALGKTQQIEASVSISGRYRPDVTVPSDGATYTFKESKSVDVFFQLVHRNLFHSRIGVDIVRSFAVGDTSSRSSYLSFRGFLSREFRQGRGSWDGEVAYSNTQDNGNNGGADIMKFGKSRTGTISAAGTLYYRLSPSLFVMGSFGLGRFALQSTIRDATGAVSLKDPAVISLSAFLRAAYRF